MKPFITLFSAIILILTSCDPDEKEIFTLEKVRIDATLNNTNAIINLGDTIKIKAVLPDIINASSGNVNLTTLQKAQFYMYLNKVDTINNVGLLMQPPTYWVVKGQISSTNYFDFEFTKSLKPYEVEIYFKPPSKGIFYLNVVSQAGQFEANNGYSARLYVNFNVPNKHIELAAPFFGQAWANDAQTREFGTYVFRVN
ncbi:hypothetical protein ACFOWM_00445 [Ferruginibacter yonginensis]|uniref:DUF4249 domain-containing protein n=1 Tax=Ferruginibacter yonginensis TaxID=1310416 RepID=A0ABV8QM74_9BACT